MEDWTLYANCMDRAREQERHAIEQQGKREADAAERTRQAGREERRTRALEDAARAAEGANRPRVCGWEYHPLGGREYWVCN